MRWLIASRRMYVVTYYLSYFSVDWLSNLNVEAFKKAYYQVVHTHRNQYRILKAVVGLVWGIIFGERFLLILIWMSMWLITFDKPSIGFNWHYSSPLLCTVYERSYKNTELDLVWLNIPVTCVTFCQEWICTRKKSS